MSKSFSLYSCTKLDMYKYYVLILSLFISATSFSQGQNNNWLLASTINYNTATPTISPAANNSGGNSISDNAGNLLFYVKADTVFNANYNSMPNGGGINFPSSSQGSVIVPKPGSPNLYYSFTIGNSVTYSVIDMSLYAGKGDVTNKNILVDNVFTNFILATNISATKHRNGVDFWIIIKSPGVFATFLLSNNGFGPVNFYQESGSNFELYADYPDKIKISNNGCWIAATNNGTFDFSTQNLELYHFNNLTGAISAGAYINTPSFPSALEFSPDNTKLYVGQAHHYTFAAGNPEILQPILQFNLNLGTTAQILASPTAVSTNIRIYNMQAAPDGKIYFIRIPANLNPYSVEANTSFLTNLGAIENPNATGFACSVNLSAITNPVLNFSYGFLPNDYNLAYSGPLDNCTYITPLTWIALGVKKINENALVSWSTASESDNKKFDVEFSLNGIQFNTIGSVDASISNASINNYSFVDNQLYKYNEKVVYYRIKQIDINGASSYSKIINLPLSINKANVIVHTYPNPFTESFTIELNTIQTPFLFEKIELYSNIGKLVYTESINKSNNRSIIIKNLPILESGIYFLKSYINSKIYINKIIKK